MKVILLVKDTEVIANKEKTDDDFEMVEKMALSCGIDISALDIIRFVLLRDHIRILY